MIQLTATDADDPTYGNSARVVYSILEGQPYFSVDAKTGKIWKKLPLKHLNSNQGKPAFLSVTYRVGWISNFSSHFNYFMSS